MPREETVQRERRALELRRARATYADIGRTLDCTTSAAWKMVHRALHRIPAPAVEELRTEESDMLDRLHRAVWPAAVGGDLKAAQVVIRLSQRRSRLLGLDAPVKVDTTLRTKLDQEITELVDQLSQLPPADDEP